MGWGFFHHLSQMLVAEVLVREIITRLGISKKIGSDKGPHVANVTASVGAEGRENGMPKTCHMRLMLMQKWTWTRYRICMHMRSCLESHEHRGRAPSVDYRWWRASPKLLYPASPNSQMHQWKHQQMPLRPIFIHGWILYFHLGKHMQTFYLLFYRSKQPTYSQKHCE